MFACQIDVILYLFVLIVIKWGISDDKFPYAMTSKWGLSMNQRKKNN